MKHCKTCGADLEQVHPELAHVLDNCIKHTKATQKLEYSKKGESIHGLREKLANEHP